MNDDVIRFPTFGVSVPDAIRMLQFKLGVDGDGRPLEDASLFYTPWEAFDGLPPADPYDITFQDLMATVAMNSNVASVHLWVLSRLRRDPDGWSRVTSALRQIPVSADIRFSDTFSGPTAAILRAFLGDSAPGNIRTAILFKVLCRLRPGLFPMWDNLVQGYAVESPLGLSFDRRYFTRGWQAIPWFRQLVWENWEQLQLVTARLALDGVPITELRALESLLWLRLTNRALVFTNAPYPWSGTAPRWVRVQTSRRRVPPSAWPAQPPDEGAHGVAAGAAD